MKGHFIEARKRTRAGSRALVSCFCLTLGGHFSEGRNTGKREDRKGREKREMSKKTPRGSERKRQGPRPGFLFPPNSSTNSTFTAITFEFPQITLYRWS